MNKDDLFLFNDDAAEAEAEITAFGLTPWAVLVVDDDDSIHQITALVLKNFSFEQRPLQLLHATSARQAE